ncbi:hypothetical protein [Acinetobacter towneri]|uniref:hypothetical protein n=1 Tax=Acinetobacter towneri TaxID=202956 RepID=UPI002B263F34|nr:hypothetical protein [Acinetobacter towneri]WPC32560.1 hypothetical protein O4J62_02710 [Acinetobacter towneri]
MTVARMFENNTRVTEELFQHRSKAIALGILSDIQDKMTIQASKDEIDEIIEYVEGL